MAAPAGGHALCGGRHRRAGNQQSENDNNKNREYPQIDARIKQTYIAESTAQKTKLYDMYARFFRWASDRLDANGILAFVTNRSFIESRTFDGFRKTVAQEFSDIYVVDLGGDVRANPRLSGTRHNVFGIQTGVAISFMVKRQQATKDKKPARVYYARRPELETADEKRAFLASQPLRTLAFDEISPDKNGHWLHLTSNDFDSLIPLASKETKAAKTGAKERAIFKLFSQGVKTNRDEWVCDFSKGAVVDKVRHLVGKYNGEVRRLTGAATDANVANLVDYEIKWTRKLKKLLVAGTYIDLDESLVRESIYRPFATNQTYFSWQLNEDLYQLAQVLPEGVSTNPYIAFVEGQRLAFSVLAGDRLPNYAMFSLDPVQCCFLHRYDEAGNRHDNITDWALKQFSAHYKAAEPSPQPSPSGRGSKPGARKISKEAIFHYCYAVLHDPVYREKYAQNLKREFPRIPFYPDFWRWADWGAELMQLHTGYEAVAPFALARHDEPDLKARAAGLPPKVLLKSDPASGSIAIDSETTLHGVPPEAWAYRLGNRSAIDWVLDQHKEKKPKDPTIRERFDTYRFADHKERVIDLLRRVATVSVQTMAIVQAMKAAAR